MDKLQLSREQSSQHGFSLLETLIAITILSVGLLSMAALMARTMASANSSRYMSTQSLLASELLDDLSSRSALDPDIAVPNGVSAGSLTANASQNVNGNAVDYFDQVEMSNGNGALVETSSSTNAQGQKTYVTTTHSLSTGTVTPDVVSANQPPATPDTLVFTRRWLVEQDVPLVGVRRITVVVTVQATPPATPFQMSMVRP